MLERHTAFATHQNPRIREQVNQLIVTLRKALAQQKQLEQTCNRLNLPVEYRWSLNSVNVESKSSDNGFPLDSDTKTQS